MSDITACPTCKGHTANSIIDGGRVCCFCGTVKGRVDMFEKWCPSCRRMTPHRLADGSKAVADAYCVVCAGLAEHPASDTERPEDALAAAGFTEKQIAGLRVQRWKAGRGDYRDDQGG